MNSLIFKTFLWPGRSSTPDETSTHGASAMRAAVATLAAVSPPDSIQLRPNYRPASRVQSNGAALPPGSAPGRAGGLASKISQSATF